MPYINNKGVKTHYKVEGYGQPLVMLHGLFLSIQEWYEDNYVEKLRSENQLILIDQRGRGKSDKPHHSDSYSLNIFRDDVIMVLDELEINRTNVFGFSMGGWVTYSLARCYPERINSIIVSDGVPEREDPNLFRNMINTMDEWIPELQDATPADKSRLLNNDRLALLALTEWVEKDIQDILDFVDSTIDLIDLPCLVFVSGPADDSDEYRLLKKTADTIPDAIFIEFKNLTHRGLHKRIDLVLPHINHFLEGVRRQYPLTE